MYNHGRSFYHGLTGLCPGWSEWWLHSTKINGNEISYKSSDLVLLFTMQVVVKVDRVVVKKASVVVSTTLSAEPWSYVYCNNDVL